MNFERHENELRALGDQLLNAADLHEWGQVGELHSLLQQKLVALFQRNDLPTNGKPAQLLREIQALSEDLSRRASHARRKAGEHLSQLQHQRRGVRLYQDCQRA